ncbi:MAG: hypothetical protein Q8R45_01520 [Brevundimonas sp.]|uniref:hypothetical protein n=1 Tax=Brevundimonas sp. TaxID=1871086 RepID=UPI002717BBDB|nr:hypothetical protein [Brevundimonas sp.]MDO9586337.1 hypothetical protein [Brevundimonas sp.]MDP2765413.1 hypothetical protein [Brevundimonas sp.]MDP3655631.1 hypothetical protein [Brevundimonas sp.]MDZ4113336.1 hypothetical protein [Brevundimonas sp.]
MKRALIGLSAAVLSCVASCAEQPPSDSLCPAHEQCQELTIAFLDFGGERVDLLIDGAPVFSGVLQTDDPSTGLSKSVRLSAASGSPMELAIDGVVVRQEALLVSTRTVYAFRRTPYIRQADHPAPLLD